MPDEYGRNRIQFRFWLDANDPHQNDLGYALLELKKARKYAPTLRNALTLWFTLQHGRTDVLQEHFPHIVEKLAGNDDNDTLQRILAELETLKATASAVSDNDTGSSVALDVPAFDLNFDDIDFDDLTEAVDVGSGDDDDAAQNLINSLMNL
ncbi:MAG: hypothetical protein AAF787_19545 [Chloroflexota bacterium]